jgi:DNA-directed RNA polymerase subunit N (RpoN/RPB10)
MLLTPCEICGKVLSTNETESYHRRLLLGNEETEPLPRCFACCNIVKNLLLE